MKNADDGFWEDSVNEALSLGKKIVIMVIMTALLLSGTCLCVTAVVVQNLMDKEYLITGDSMAATVAVTVDGDRMAEITDKVMEIYRASGVKLDNTRWEDPAFEDYAQQYLHLMEDEAYIDIRDSLRKIQDVNEVDCVYTLCVSPGDNNLVYIVDGAYDDIVTPGCFDLIEECCLPYVDDLTQGFPAFITNTPEYGWMVTSCAPIYDSGGNVVCFAAVDLSMNDIRGKVHRFLDELAVIMFILTAAICFGAIMYVRKMVVGPINLLSEAAGQYSRNTKGGSHTEFSHLDIHTGDELEVLFGSMVKMEKDIDSYIKNLTRTKAQLTSAIRQADDMNELAHKDALTGVRNKLAYDKEMRALDSGIGKGEHDFGIAMIDLNYLKVINDSCGHEYGNAALITLCRLICDIFVHSPVFRIGGDEFAVILKNHDYDNIITLMDEFNQRIEKLAADKSLRKWEKISAAFGYALFDADTDHCADDVFKRADMNMYERKKEMKAVRE